MRTKWLSWLGVGLVIRGSLVQFPAGALWSVLGRDSLFHIASVYPAAKWVPSINKAVLRVCALYAGSCSGISPWGIEMVSVCAVPGRSCERFGGYKTINRIPLPRGQAMARDWGRPPGYRFPKLHSPIENFIVPLKNKNKNELPWLS